MKAIILAAGFGSRLMPYTADRPKGMVEINGMTVIGRQLVTLRAAGIQEIVLVGGYRGEQLAQYGLPVEMNTDYHATNMVASLMCCRETLDGTEDAIIAYSDIVYERHVLDSVISGTGALTVASDRSWRELWHARMDDPTGDIESFKVDRQGKIIEIGGHPASLDDVQGQFIGLLKLPAESQEALVSAFDHLRPPPKMFMTEFIQHLIDISWDVRPAWIDGGWLEIDTVEDLDRYHELARARRLDKLCIVPNVIETSFLKALGGHTGVSSTELDTLAREIEIKGKMVDDSMLATFLLAYAETLDLRRINTVLKATSKRHDKRILEWVHSVLS
jgi:choline kinase